MNWTGGRLSRHSLNAKGSITQKQKQYFAKVRKNPLNGGQKGSPIKLSLFEQDRVTPQPTLPDPPAPASTSSNQVRNQTGRRLYDNTRKRVGQSEGACLISSTPTVTQQKRPSSRQVRLLQNESHLDYRPSGSPQEEALLYPQRSKRRRHMSSVLAKDAKLTRVLEEEESLNERRRKILDRSDWVGADIQRPLKLKYTSLTADEKIGKRRRIDLDENKFGTFLQPVISSPFEAPKRKSMTPETMLTYPYRDETQSGWIPKSRNHVRIIIGGKNKPVGVTSSTSHRLMQIDQSISSQASISDVMLLDGEDTSRCYNTSSRGGEGQYSDPPLPPLLGSKAIWSRGLQTDISEKRSGPQLLHPIPQSLRKPPVLRTASPDDDGSVVAQLGVARPVVPLCQLLDEEVWKTWILSLDTTDKVDEFEQHGMDEVLFSPGISTITHRRDQGSLTQCKIAKENPLATTQEENSEIRFGHGTELEEGNHDGEMIPSVVVLQDKPETHFPGEALNTLPSTDYKKYFLLHSKPARSPPKAVLQPSPEEAWMKFILTDSVTCEENGLPISATCQQKARIELPTLLLPESSLLAHPSTEAALSTHPSSSYSTMHSSSFATKATLGSTATFVHNTRVSNDSTRGPGRSSSPDPISRSPSHLSRHHFPISSKIRLASNLPTIRKVLFKKPPRYTMRDRGRSCSPDELAGGRNDILHIGQKRKIAGKGAQKYTDKYRKRQRLKDIYSLSSSDDDIESIEDI